MHGVEGKTASHDRFDFDELDDLEGEFESGSNDGDEVVEGSGTNAEGSDVLRYVFS